MNLFTAFILVLACVPAALSGSDWPRTSITRGRAFLLSRQAADGSWPETTRSANQESYAQRISTTGWALRALLDTQ